MTTILLVVTLAAQATLFCFTAISRAAPDCRVWPPPSRNSWQFHATWLLSWISLSGVFLLALTGGNSLGLPAWLRVGLGIPLLLLGVFLVAWGIRALSVPTTLGLPGAFIRSGPYRFSRNPQYLGTCISLAALVVLSGSQAAAAGCLAVGLWFLATPFVEEPWLAARYGAEYEAYRRAVPRFVGLRLLGAGGRQGTARGAHADLRLCPVTRENSSDLAGYAREFADAGESGSFALPGNDPEAFLARVEMFEAGRDLPENRVRMSWFWLLRCDRIVASSRIRHELIPAFLLDGGHIGYEVRPSERRRGIGTALLRLTLDEARAMGLRRVLLTTEATNLGSIGVIRANGGAFEDTSVSPNTGRTLNRYWITL